jgi:Ca2+-binding EF-hand superfamily protein
MKPIKELFDFYDNNSDGVISKREFVELVENLLHERGMGKSTEILKDYDFNENGVMDFDEFELFAKNQLGCID